MFAIAVIEGVKYRMSKGVFLGIGSGKRKEPIPRKQNTDMEIIIFPTPAP
jgi:hypothetical protein